MDFQFDGTADGRQLKFLIVIDEHKRFCLTIRFRADSKSVPRPLAGAVSMS